MTSLSIDELTAIVIECCIKIHNAVGPCCFERIYEELLYYELTKRGIDCERQLLLDIEYDELLKKNAYKIDLLVDYRLVVELKSLHPLPPVYFKQIRTQLTLIKLKYGMLINFMEEKITQGIHRVYNNHGREFRN